MTQSLAKGRRERSSGSEIRGNKITVRLSDAELASVGAAAERAGLAPGAYLAQAGLDTAELRAVRAGVFEQQILTELNRLSGLVRRIGVNLNQAVAKLNATGAPGPDLEPAAAYCMGVARHVDDAALLARRRLP